MTRALVVDDEAKEKVKVTLLYAKHHVYEPSLLSSVSEISPGDDPGHVVMLNTFRCVFSYTRFSSKLYRHLSISVPSELYPNPIAVTAIAELFGFTGSENGLEAQLRDSKWMVHISRKEHCVVLAEQMGEQS
jgi:hypothetical protein